MVEAISLLCGSLTAFVLTSFWCIATYHMYIAWLDDKSTVSFEIPFIGKCDDYMYLNDVGNVMFHFLMGPLLIIIATMIMSLAWWIILPVVGAIILALHHKMEYQKKKKGN